MEVMHVITAFIKKPHVLVQFWQAPWEKVASPLMERRMALMPPPA
jgi:hypothetical protein